MITKKELRMKKFLIVCFGILICGAAIAAEIQSSEGTKEYNKNSGSEQLAVPPETSEQTALSEDKKIKKIELVKIPCSKFGAYPACKYEEIAVETSDNPENLNWDEANAVCAAKEMRLPTSSELHSMLMAAQEGVIHPFQSANYWADSVDDENSNICYMGFGNCDKRNKQKSKLPFRCVEK